MDSSVPNVFSTEPTLPEREGRGATGRSYHKVGDVPSFRITPVDIPLFSVTSSSVHMVSVEWTRVPGPIPGPLAGRTSHSECHTRLEHEKGSGVGCESGKDVPDRGPQFYRISHTLVKSYPKLYFPFRRLSHLRNLKWVRTQESGPVQTRIPLFGPERLKRVRSPWVHQLSSFLTFRSHCPLTPLLIGLTKLCLSRLGVVE